MSNIVNPYTTFSKVTETGMVYWFISIGKKTIAKAVKYIYMEEFMGKPVFNLAFGDFNYKTGGIIDNTISNNGDHYRVFQTILSTIPKFLEINKSSIIRVQGYDSRRTNIYRTYVERNYEELSKEYIFYVGKTTESHIDIRLYEKGGHFDYILVSKKM